MDLPGIGIRARSSGTRYNMDEAILQAGGVRGIAPETMGESFVCPYCHHQLAMVNLHDHLQSCQEENRTSDKDILWSSRGDK